MKVTRNRWAVVVVLVVLFAGCAGDGATHYSTVTTTTGLIQQPFWKRESVYCMFHQFDDPRCTPK